MHSDIVIIGAGIVGVATAWFLRQRGVNTVILDGAPDLGCRTTAMAAHCIRAQFSESENIAMMAESLDFYERFGEHCGLASQHSPIDLCQQGYLFVSTDPADRPAFAERVDRQRQAGLDDVELLDGDDARSRYPWLSNQIVAATYRARDGWIDSRKAVEILAATSRAPVYLAVRVERIEITQGRVTGIETNAGRIATDTVILAAGPFSRSLSPEPLPIALWRRQRVIVAANDAIPPEAPVTIDANTGAHWRPHRGGGLMAWAQAENDAEATWPVTPDPAFTDLVLRSENGVGRIAPFWRDLAHDLANEDIQLTAGQYTMTPDHRPLIGPARQTEGLFLHTGYSGHGIMGSPAGARRLAEIITGDLASPNPFAPSRFDGATTPPDVEQVVI